MSGIYQVYTIIINFLRFPDAQADPQSPRDVIVSSANSNRNHLNIQPTVTQVLSPPANSSLTIISSPITSRVPCGPAVAAY